jgi:hypothetical protein
VKVRGLQFLTAVAAKIDLSYGSFRNRLNLTRKSEMGGSPTLPRENAAAKTNGRFGEAAPRQANQAERRKRAGWVDFAAGRAGALGRAAALRVAPKHDIP